MQNVRSEDWKETKSQGSQTGHDAIHFARFERMQDFSILKAWRKVKLHGSQAGFLRRADEFPVWKGVKLQGSQTSQKSRSAVSKQNCMVLKQLVNLKYFEKIISNIQRFEGLEEGKITWCSNP